MSSPPECTVIMVGVPEGYSVGIDYNFFTANQIFRGIKLVPQGFHIVHWASNTEDTIRLGFAFIAEEGKIVIMRWDAAQEEMLIGEQLGDLNISAERQRLPEYYPYMVGYPKDQSMPMAYEDWLRMTEWITESLLSKVFPSAEPFIVTSTTTSKQENELLLRVLQDAAQKRSEQSGGKLKDDELIKSLVSQENSEIAFLPIDKRKSHNPNAPERRTKDSIDKSWYLLDLVRQYRNGNLFLVLGELQLCFLLSTIFANYSACLQWTSLLELVCHVEDMLRPEYSQSSNTRRFIELFIQIVELQLANIPEEYIEELFDPKIVGKSLARFYHTLAQLRDEYPGDEYLRKLHIRLTQLGFTVKRSLGVSIERSPATLAIQHDGQAEDDEDMETGEFAPVVVEL